MARSGLTRPLGSIFRHRQMFRVNSLMSWGAMLFVRVKIKQSMKINSETMKQSNGDLKQIAIHSSGF